MKNPSVYLSGPITNLTYGECTEWREYAKKALNDHGIDAFSPMRGKRYLDRGNKVIPDCPDKHERPLSTTSAITMRDRWDCKSCDVILVNVLGSKWVSVGTMVEVGWADAYDHPVVVCMEEGTPHDRAILRGVAGVITPNLDDALDAVISILKP